RARGVGLDRSHHIGNAGHVPDEAFEAVRQQFSEKEIVDLTAAAIAINSWNKIAIAFRVPPQVENKKAAALGAIKPRECGESVAGALRADAKASAIPRT
ncbi:MAG: hypothetical protein WCC43_12930, partial [Pseudolabrys sp.]